MKKRPKTKASLKWSKLERDSTKRIITQFDKQFEIVKGHYRCCKKWLIVSIFDIIMKIIIYGGYYETIYEKNSTLLSLAIIK